MTIPDRVNHHAICRSRIRLCDQFRDEVAQRLKHVQPDGYEAQELNSAKNALIRAHAKASAVLRSLPKPTRLDEPDEFRRRVNEAREAQEVGSKLLFVERLRAQGDFRQAKIHLLATLDIRGQIERETA